MQTRSILRQTMRCKRKALAETEQFNAADKIASRITRLPEYRKSRRIAAYMAANGEVDCTFLLRLAYRHGKQIFLPYIQAKNRMAFRRWTPTMRMGCNRFGIHEPDSSAYPLTSPSSIDLIIVPLLAFDRRANRLGMGGGFYDRSLAQRGQISSRPLLVGVAYDFQFVERLVRSWWDIPLDTVITPTKQFRFHRKRYQKV